MTCSKFFSLFRRSFVWSLVVFVGVLLAARDSRGAGGINEATFHSILDKIEALYTPEVARYGRTLIVHRLWNSRHVQAQAVQNGRVWQITFHGGLARHHTMEPDAFAHIACHELGHHLGGAPRTGVGISSEGQADYFATLKCLRRVFAETGIETLPGVPAIAAQECARAHRELRDVRICERSTMASLAVGRFNAAYWPTRHTTNPQLETPETSVAPFTLPGYGTIQCRLDTSFQGALCPRSVDERLSFTDPTVGACSPERGDVVGARPLCWYRGSR